MVESLINKTNLLGVEKILLQEYFGNNRNYVTVDQLTINVVDDYNNLLTLEGKFVFVKENNKKGLFVKTGTTEYIFGIKMYGYERIYDGLPNVKWFGAIGDGSVHFLSEKYSSLTVALNDYVGLGLVSNDLNIKTIDEVAFWYSLKWLKETYKLYNGSYVAAPYGLFLDQGHYIFNDGITAPIINLTGDHTFISSSSGKTLFKVDETNGTYRAKFEKITFIDCESVINSWNSTDYPTLQSFLYFTNCNFNNIEYVIKSNLTPNAWFNVLNCVTQNCGIFKGQSEHIYINNLQGENRHNVELPTFYLGGEDIDENGDLKAVDRTSTIDVIGCHLSPIAQYDIDPLNITTSKRVWVYTNTNSTIRLSHNRFGGEYGGNPLIMVDELNNIFVGGADIYVAATKCYSTTRPSLILNSSIEKLHITPDCTLSFIGQSGMPIFIKNISKYLTDHYGCQYPLGSQTDYISYLDINVPDWFCSSDLLYLKKYLKNNNYLPNSFDWFTNLNTYTNLPTNCGISTVTNFGVDFNKVTAISSNAVNYATYDVLSLGLPTNQTVYCTIKYKGSSKNTTLQIITTVNGKYKYEQIRLNNTNDGFAFIHFPVFSNLKTIRIITELDNGQTFEFDSPKFSYF